MDVFLPKGTRDFLPPVMRARQQVMQTIRAVFERYGFGPLETPAFERIETLMGKYGAETDKLMFQIHKRGRHAKPGECDLGLRYDLTVPLARVIAMNQGLPMPFKRYQMQPVWRAERSQRGRYREFYQCDVDIVGSNSPLAEAECLAVLTHTLGALGFSQYVLKLNHRHLLADMAVLAGATTKEQERAFLIALDKLDKLGREAVQANLARQGFFPGRLQVLWNLTNDSPSHVLDQLQGVVGDRGQAGVANLREVVEASVASGVPIDRIQIDPSLARGADYYTGCVYEVHAPDAGLGSLGAGGRYDQLIGAFSGRPLPAVGVSLGLERLLVLMEQQGAFSTGIPPAKVFVTVFDRAHRSHAIATATALRQAAIPTELYVGTKRLKHQVKLAHTSGIPWVAVVGPTEAEQGGVQLKHLPTGKSQFCTLDQAITQITHAP